MASSMELGAEVTYRYATIGLLILRIVLPQKTIIITVAHIYAFGWRGRLLYQPLFVLALGRSCGE